MIPLSKILTEPQFEAVLDIIRSEPDSIERVKRLKAYLAPFRAELKQKGIVLEYLAYMIEYLAATHKLD